MMSFEVAADAYGRFMGRFSEQLATAFLDLLEVREGRALDVGCGPGVLTAPLVARLGASKVAAVDPSESFVAAARDRLPGVDIRHGHAEELPFGGDEFDVTLAQLVVHFMSDPVRGLAEMARVTRPGGLLGTSVWDHPGDRGPLSPFWRAVRELSPGHGGEDDLAGSREGDLVRLCGLGGWADVEGTTLTVSSRFDSFEDWWEPYTLGVGTAGGYLVTLDPDTQAALHEQCRAQLGAGPFEIEATAWVATGRVSGP
ncbi:MAG: class I SAM-dependent methyltransferase [Nocardioidaceae bacterium]